MIQEAMLKNSRLDKSIIKVQPLEIANQNAFSIFDHSPTIEVIMTRLTATTNETTTLNVSQITKKTATSKD